VGKESIRPVVLYVQAYISVFEVSQTGACLILPVSCVHHGGVVEVFYTAKASRRACLGALALKSLLHSPLYHCHNSIYFGVNSLFFLSHSERSSQYLQRKPLYQLCNRLPLKYNARNATPYPPPPNTISSTWPTSPSQFRLSPPPTSILLNPAGTIVALW